jgi:hypothetical protein
MLEKIEGDFLDQRDDLDAKAIGKNQKPAQPSNGRASGAFTDLDTLRAEIVSGASLHFSVTRIAGKMVKSHVPKDMCIDYVRSAFDEADAARYDGRWPECSEAINDIYTKEESKQQVAADTAALSMEMFRYHSEENKFIFEPTGALWQKAAVNSLLPPVGRLSAATIIIHERAVQQATWWPGEERLIRHKLVHQGGFIAHPNATVFNYYRPPHVIRGLAAGARMFVDHVELLYPDEYLHILRWLACRVQRPNVKINHALVLGGAQGIGKDTLLFPAMHAVGHWNVQTVSPSQVLEKFNGCLRSVLLLITEARDMGEVNRPAFYEHLKTIIAAPPDVIYINEKNKQQYYIPNLTGVVITTNHKAGGIFLSPEDRRHFIAWSSLEQKDFQSNYFERIWDAYHGGTLLNDAAEYLRTLDLSAFDPKRKPPETAAFWEMVSAGQQPEVVDLQQALDDLGSPVIVAADELLSPASRIDAETVVMLKKNRRMLQRWMEQCDYKVVRNPGDRRDGAWQWDGKRHVVFGKNHLSDNELMKLIALKRR